MTKEVKVEKRMMVELGFEYLGQNGGHHQFRHPRYGRVSLPESPSDHRWRLNFRTQVARRLGITKAELERKSGVR